MSKPIVTFCCKDTHDLLHSHVTFILICVIKEEVHHGGRRWDTMQNVAQSRLPLERIILDKCYSEYNSKNRTPGSTLPERSKKTESFLLWIAWFAASKLRTTVNRKPAQTDWFLEESSSNLTSHKDMTIKTSTRGALLVADSSRVWAAVFFKMTDSLATLFRS